VTSRGYSALAALAALLGYLATASPSSYWLDGGELVSATVALDIIHPPGHPLTALWGKAFTLLPLGSLALRVALGQAFAAALGIYFLCAALQRATAALELPQAIGGPLAVAASCTVAFCFGLWFQAVRPEVYALQALVLMIAMERLSALAASEYRDGRALLGACVAIGLGLTNHHLMAFFFFPALAYGALRVANARKPFGAARIARPLLLCTAAGALCLLVYAYLPLRALSDPPLNLGSPTTLERIYWVVSAKVYAREMGEANPQPLDERYLDVIVVLVEQLGWLVVLLACVGGYASARNRALRATGLLWLLIGGAVLLVRPYLGPVRGNPDSMGYLIAGYCAVATFAMLGVAVLLSTWQGVHASSRAARAVTIVLCALMIGSQVAAQAGSSSLATFASIEPFDDVRVRGLPPRSVVVATTPQTVFRQLELMATERVRPDLELIALPFLRYPGVAESTLRRAPELRGIVESYLARDVLDPSALVDLARSRPVMVELDTMHIEPAGYGVLEPDGALYRVRAGAAPLDWPKLLENQERRQRALTRQLHGALNDPDALRLVLWLRYTDALYFAALGQRAAALRALEAARALYPEDAHVLAMYQALAASPGEGPIDVRPFLRLE
jgi:hypothetical protein